MSHQTDSSRPFIFFGNQGTKLDHEFSEHLVMNNSGLNFLKAQLEILESKFDNTGVQEITFSTYDCESEIFGIAITELAPKIDLLEPSLKDKLYTICSCSYVLVWTILFLGLLVLGVIKLVELGCKLFC